MTWCVVCQAGAGGFAGVGVAALRGKVVAVGVAAEVHADVAGEDLQVLDAVLVDAGMKRTLPRRWPVCWYCSRLRFGSRGRGPVGEVMPATSRAS